MGALSVGLTMAAALVVLGMVTAVLLGTVLRRRRAAYVVGGIALTVGVALEVSPRVLLSRDLHPACLEGPVRVAFAGGSATWQALTGGLQMRALIGPDQVEELVTDRFADGPLDDLAVDLEDDSVDVSGRLGTQLGTLPLAVRVEPEVTDGRLRFVPTSGEVAGRELPAVLLARLSGAMGSGGRGGSGSGGCGGGLGGGGDLGGRVEAAQVGTTGLELTVRM